MDNRQRDVWMQRIKRLENRCADIGESLISAVRAFRQERARAEAAENERDVLQTAINTMHVEVAKLRSHVEQVSGKVDHLIAERDALKAQLEDTQAVIRSDESLLVSIAVVEKLRTALDAERWEHAREHERLIREYEAHISAFKRFQEERTRGERWYDEAQKLRGLLREWNHNPNACYCADGHGQCLECRTRYALGVTNG